MILLQTSSNISSQQQIVTNSQYQPYYLRPGYRFKTNLVCIQSYMIDDILVIGAGCCFHSTNDNIYKKHMYFGLTSEFLITTAYIVICSNR